MLRYLFLLSILTLIVSCGNPTPQTEAVVTAETSPAAEVATAPQAPSMPRDQIERTAEANPEVINEAKITPAKIKPEAPSKPVKPAPNATKPAASKALASSAPISAPAPAPIKETSAPAPTATPSSKSATEAPTPPYTASAKPDHTAFNTLLGKYVNASGDVNYAAFKKDEAKLDAYIAELSKNSPQSDWSRSESMAFWINAYNANTVKLVLKNYPLASIIDLDGGKPWDVKWIEIGGKTYSLNNIEHDIIRPRYKDARIHFAVNCAAASCPPLPNKAFTASNLNSLLASRTKSFVQNGRYNTITTEKVQVSKIFDWYGEDFGDLRGFLNKYTRTEISASTDISFQEYDWALNEQ
ncbi:MAG: hypothetical protein ACI92C_002433 [Neolewinella sp.]|jgi:hypothetical protein